MSLDDEADELIAKRRAEGAALADGYRRLSAAIGALAKEFAAAAVRRKPATTWPGLNKDAWLVLVDTQIIAVFDDGSWAWVVPTPTNGSNTVRLMTAGPLIHRSVFTQSEDTIKRFFARSLAALGPASRPAAEPH